MSHARADTAFGIGDMTGADGATRADDMTRASRNMAGLDVTADMGARRNIGEDD
jgi:hypothetical protein